MSPRARAIPVSAETTLFVTERTSWRSSGPPTPKYSSTTSRPSLTTSRLRMRWFLPARSTPLATMSGEPPASATVAVVQGSARSMSTGPSVPGPTVVSAQAPSASARSPCSNPRALRERRGTELADMERDISSPVGKGTNQGLSQGSILFIHTWKLKPEPSWAPVGRIQLPRFNAGNRRAKTAYGLYVGQYDVPRRCRRSSGSAHGLRSFHQG